MICDSWRDDCGVTFEVRDGGIGRDGKTAWSGEGRDGTDIAGNVAVSGGRGGLGLDLAGLGPSWVAGRSRWRGRMDGWRAEFNFAQLCLYDAVGVNVDVGLDVFIISPTIDAVKPFQICFLGITAPNQALGNANTELLARDDRVSKELATALRQVLISTQDVPLTDGYRRNLRHEGHNLNVAFGSLTVFVTFNFADNYAPLLFKLCNGEEVMGDITCDVSAEQPDMPSLHRMQQFIAESPRAQVQFFKLMDDIVDIYFMGIDGSFIGRHHVQPVFSHSLREDRFPCTCIPGLRGLRHRGTRTLRVSSPWLSARPPQSLQDPGHPRARRRAPLPGARSGSAA